MVDLFICEAYFFDKKVKYHLDYQTLRRCRERIECRRLILTHMSQDMLSRLSPLGVGPWQRKTRQRSHY